MHVELSRESQARLEDALEQIAMQSDLDDLAPEELIGALLDMAADMMVVEEASPLARARLIDYCARRVIAR